MNKINLISQVLRETYNIAIDGKIWPWLVLYLISAVAMLCPFGIDFGLFQL